jgi:hypothetical protein
MKNKDIPSQEKKLNEFIASKLASQEILLLI